MYAHRLAWLFVYGEMPSGKIKHIDKNKANNAIDNLTCGQTEQKEHVPQINFL